MPALQNWLPSVLVSLICVWSIGQSSVGDNPIRPDSTATSAASPNPPFRASSNRRTVWIPDTRIREIANSVSASQIDHLDISKDYDPYLWAARPKIGSITEKGSYLTLSIYDRETIYAFLVCLRKATEPENHALFGINYPIINIYLKAKSGKTRILPTIRLVGDEGSHFEQILRAITAPPKS